MNFLNPLGALIPKIPFAFFFILGPGRLRSWQQHIEGGQHRQPQMTAARSRPANVHHPLARTTLKFENLTETIPRAARRYKQWPSPHECTGHQVIPQSPPPKDKKGEQWAAGQQTLSLKHYPWLQITKNPWSSWTTRKRNHQIPWFQCCANNNCCCPDRALLSQRGGYNTAREESS